MSVTSLKAARVDKRIEELRACDNIREVHVVYRLECGAAMVCVVPFAPQEPEPGADPSGWGQPTAPYLLHVDPDLHGTAVRPQLVIHYPDRES